MTVIGAAGQDRLARAAVMIVGCGALGGQLAMLLAGAGVGRIGIADFDTIDITNLQRQLFFSEAQAGKGKASIIGERMEALNSEIEVEVYQEMITQRNAEDVFSRYDLIIDATDNPATKYFIDNVTRRLGLPCCIGGVAGWRGQVVMLSGSGDSLRYGDIFSRPDADPSMMPCEIEGVMGPAASTIASLQAAEAVKWLIADEADRRPVMISVDLSAPLFNVMEL